VDGRGVERVTDEQESRFEGAGWSGSGSERKVTSMEALKENRVLKRLHVKQSIHHALNSLKGYCPASATEPASPLG